MKREEKIKQQRMIKQNIDGLAFKINKLIEMKNAYRGLKEQTLKQSETYSVEFLKNKTIEEEQKFIAQCQAKFEEFQKSLEELRFLINERDAILDLEDTALANALKLIETVGANLDDKNIQNINANFANDQTSLRALQAAYLAKGITFSGLDTMIYNPNEKIDHLIEVSKGAIVQQGSLNYLADEIAKIAKLEGVEDFIKTPDEQGFMEAMRRGAGL
jgi:hypothetical protein